jgi:pimeloyl-ACP methyl ester carboxylesterase
MPQLRIRRASLAYSEEGSGPPLVLVHGSASDCRTWERQLPVLAGKYRVIVYSRRYHWPNEPIPEDADYSMAEQVHDLEAVLEALGLSNVHLVGHSYGAFLVLLLALRRPDLVRTMVLAEPPVFTLFVSNTPKPAELLKLLATRPRTAIAIVKFGATGIGPATSAAQRGDMQAAMRIFGSAVLGRDAYRRLSEARLEQIRANAFRAEFLGSGFPRLEPDRLRQVRSPTLLITAGRSPALFHRLNDALADLLPRTRRLEVPDASHMMHEDNPAAFNRAVMSFLDEHEAAR